MATADSSSSTRVVRDQVIYISKISKTPGRFISVKHREVYKLDILKPKLANYFPILDFNMTFTPRTPHEVLIFNIKYNSVHDLSTDVAGEMVAVDGVAEITDMRRLRRLAKRANYDLF